MIELCFHLFYLSQLNNVNVKLNICYFTRHHNLIEYIDDTWRRPESWEKSVFIIYEKNWKMEHSTLFNTSQVTWHCSGKRLSPALKLFWKLRSLIEIPTALDELSTYRNNNCNWPSFRTTLAIIKTKYWKDTLFQIRLKCVFAWNARAHGLVTKFMLVMHPGFSNMNNL